eukprot:scaffold116094_cov39-Phaeocystis_antarctica.AAC.1
MHVHGVGRRECTIRWSYAAADHALGARHAALLVEHLEKVLAIWMHMYVYYAVHWHAYCAQYNASDAVSKTRAPATYLRQVLVSAPVEMVWESTFVEVRPYGTSMSLGLLQLLDADCAA